MAQITKWDYGFAEYDGSSIHRRVDSMDDVAATSDALVPFVIAAGEKDWEFAAPCLRLLPVWPRGVGTGLKQRRFHRF